MNFDKILIAIFFFPQNNLFMLHSNRIKLTPSKCPSQRAETRPGPGRSNRPRDRSWRWKTRCWIPEKLIATFRLLRRNLFTTIANWHWSDSRVEESGSRNFGLRYTNSKREYSRTSGKFDGKFDSDASKNRRNALLHNDCNRESSPGNLNF